MKRKHKLVYRRTPEQFLSFIHLLPHSLTTHSLTHSLIMCECVTCHSLCMEVIRQLARVVSCPHHTGPRAGRLGRFVVYLS